MRSREWYKKNRWRLERGLPERDPSTFFCLDEIDDKVGNKEFENLMNGKLIMGAYRYGKIGANSKYDFIEALKNKIKLYEETHNTELLVDTANYALLEFTNPKYSDAYFKSEDDTEHAPLKTNIL